jgi:adenine-specific DNA-methyltransferase
MRVLADAGRLFDGGGKSLGGVVRWSDWPYVSLTNMWNDLHGDQDPIYVVQTNRRAVARCILMSTEPGDLVLDPTCGSGTTAHMAEQWGRRWITIDISRVPLALARQRLLTATYPYYELQDASQGPARGFVYKRRQNRTGDEVGGLVPRVTLKSVAQNSRPAEEILVDRPEITPRVTRVTGSFVVEATIPMPTDIQAEGSEDSGAPEDPSYIERMIEALRSNPSIRLPENTTLSLTNVRKPGQSLLISAEATIDGETVAILFGPENGAISEKLVYEAASEAHLKSYSRLLVIGFAIEPNARALIEKLQQLIGIPSTYVYASPDLVMTDLLKTTRSSQLFSVSGLPEIAIRKVQSNDKDGPQLYEVELLGLDTFDPVTFQARPFDGADVPAWFLDTAWNGMAFHVSQAFFPRTGAWKGLRGAMNTEFDASVWSHLAGTVSAPFAEADTRQIAVKVIDDRGNELLVTASLDEAQ